MNYRICSEPATGYMTTGCTTVIPKLGGFPQSSSETHFKTSPIYYSIYYFFQLDRLKDWSWLVNSVDKVG